jgi:hypothetical protein
MQRKPQPPDDEDYDDDAEYDEDLEAAVPC